MTVDEVVKFVDKIVFEKTGKHLDDIQTAVVEGTWKRQTYDYIASEYNLSSSHVGDVGSELWQLLSEILHEDIKKTNFCYTLERIYIKSSQMPNIYIGNNHFNFNSQTLNQPNKEDDKSNINTESKLSSYDLTLAPEIIKFYQRETELEKFSNWIFKQNTRLISVSGLYGIGKTTLVKRFVDLNLQKFAVVIWRSLKYPQPLELLVSDLLNVCQQEPQATLDKQLKQLFDILANQKCLIILDDLQNIFIPGKFAGQYKVAYQEYQNFFTLITEVKHQSHVVVISQEQSSEIECLDDELCPIKSIKSLEISGLYDVDILQNRGLKNEDSWLKLIDLYAGNFIDLKSVGILINKNYDGQVADFLAENTLHITNQMQSRLQQIFNHLSTPEKEIVWHLSKFDIPITREYLREGLNLSVIDFNNGLQSLQERYLVTKIKDDKRLFQLSSVFREYVRNYCQN